MRPSIVDTQSHLQPQGRASHRDILGGAEAEKSLPGTTLVRYAIVPVAHGARAYTFSGEL